MNTISTKVAQEIYLYGAPREESHIHFLHAGPVSVKFQDGELRYLYVGSKEIVRRVYFGVRDERWDTVMPTMSGLKIRQDAESFDLSFDAHCKNDVADYSWTGRITGDASGKIAFSAKGAANTDFRSPRIGMNILFGTESLAGQAFDLIDEKDSVKKSSFPINVQDALLVDFNSFKTLRYTTSDGMTVSAGMDTQCIGMEDQRNFGDSSYKAFSSMPYGYPTVPKGDTRTQMFTLRVTHPSSASHAGETTSVTIGKPIRGSRMPRIVAPGAPSKNGFRTYNHDPKGSANVGEFILPYNPALHMPDDDTFMENVPTVLDWVKSLRTFAPGAEFRFDPIGFDSPYPRPADDPRNAGLFAAPWCTRVIKYLALGGVGEAAFVPNGKSAATALNQLSKFAGDRVIETTVSPASPSLVDALAVEGDGETFVWLMNLTDRPQSVAVHGLGELTSRSLIGASSAHYLQTSPSTFAVPPFEVLQITTENKATGNN